MFKIIASLLITAIIGAGATLGWLVMKPAAKVNVQQIHTITVIPIISLGVQNDDFKETTSGPDLSYVQLVVNPEIEVEIKDSKRNTIPVTESVEDFSKSVKVILFKQPKPGEYQVSLMGMGAYEVDCYIYDKDGNVTQGNYEGEITSTKVGFTMTMGDNNNFMRVE